MVSRVTDTAMVTISMTVYSRVFSRCRIAPFGGPRWYAVRTERIRELVARMGK